MTLALVLSYLIHFAGATFVVAQTVNPKSLDPNDPRCIEVEFGVCTKASLDAGGLLPQIKTCEDAVTQAAIVYDGSIKAAPNSTFDHQPLKTLLYSYTSLKGSEFIQGKVDDLSTVEKFSEKLGRKEKDLRNLEKFYERARAGARTPAAERAAAKNLGRVRINLQEVTESLSRFKQLATQFPGEKTVEGLLAKAVKSHPTLQMVQQQMTERLQNLKAMERFLVGNKKFMSLRSSTVAAIRSEIRSLSGANEAVSKLIAAPSKGMLQRLWAIAQQVKQEVRFLNSAEDKIIIKYMRKSLMKGVFGRTLGAVLGNVIGVVVGELIFPEVAGAPGSELTKDLYVQDPNQMFEALKSGSVKPTQICNFATDPIFASSLDQTLAPVSDYGISEGKLREPLPQVGSLLAGLPKKDHGDILLSVEQENGGGPSLGSGGSK